MSSVGHKSSRFFHGFASCRVLTLLPRLGCSSVITAHCSLDLPGLKWTSLGLSGPPSSASQVAGTAGAYSLMGDIDAK
ncbi:Protein PPP5D1 [Plecturocebus cupreus]